VMHLKGECIRISDAAMTLKDASEHLSGANVRVKVERCISKVGEGTHVGTPSTYIGNPGNPRVRNYLWSLILFHQDHLSYFYKFV